MKKYDLFLLDADDTLFDFTACCKNALGRAMQNCGFFYRDDYHSKYLEINDTLWRRLEKKELTHERLLRLRFSEFLREINENAEKCAELNLAYMSALSEECVLFEGAEDFLKSLGKAGKIYIVTNGTASVQRARFRKFGLNRYAEDVFISEEIGAYKPSEAYFRYVANHIPAFDRQRALAIGDGLTSDIAWANAAGMDCVWYNPGKKPSAGNSAPTYVAENYEEILRIVAGG